MSALTKLWREKKKKTCIYNINKGCLTPPTKKKKILLIPVSFGLCLRVSVEFLKAFNLSHWVTFKYSQVYRILLILLLWFIYLFIYLKDQIICLNCLYVNGSLDLTIFYHEFIIQIICLNCLYLYWSLNLIILNHKLIIIFLHFNDMTYIIYS